MIACIACGGIGEWMLISAGLTCVLGWWKRRHDKKKCKCCQSHENTSEVSRPMTPEERASVNEFFMSQLEEKK